MHLLCLAGEPEPGLERCRGRRRRGADGPQGLLRRAAPAVLERSGGGQRLGVAPRRALPAPQCASPSGSAALQKPKESEPSRPWQVLPISVAVHNYLPEDATVVVTLTGGGADFVAFDVQPDGAPRSVTVEVPQVRKTPSWPRSWANLSLV